MIYRNKASQKVPIFAWDSGASSPKTGDAGNITAQISKDGAATAATDDTNPTELDSTDAPGIYLFDLTQSETDCNLLILYAKSSTANIQIDPVVLYPAEYQYPVYIEVNQDDANGQDEYSATFFRDMEPLSSGVSSVQVQVVKRSDGTDLVAAANMSDAGSGFWKYDENSNRMSSGEAYLVIVTATIDGSTRTFRRIVEAE